MTQVHQVAIVTPLIVGGGAVLCTILIHGLAVGATVNFFRHEARLGRAGMRYLIDLTIVMLVMSFASWPPVPLLLSQPRPSVGRVPQRLKPVLRCTIAGTAEAVPLKRQEGLLASRSLVAPAAECLISRF